jgi:CRISPR/Cas system CSM-associated protein Csm4 (group 5 of RAMP superfamily)
MERININSKQNISPINNQLIEIINNSINDNIDINILLEANYKYFLEFNKILKINELLKNKLKNLIYEKTNLKQKILNLEKYFNKNKNNIKINDIYINRKRHRRLKSEIKRNFLCKYCNKTYGTEASLNQHLKIKHLIIIDNKSK